MAKTRSKPVAHTSVKKKRSSRKPLWMRITRMIGLIIVTIVLLIAMIGIVQRYCHILSKH